MRSTNRGSHTSRQKPSGRMERQAKPGEGEPVSRSASEPDSASLPEVRAASLPYVMKPDAGGEAMGKSSHRALRGGWGRRMEKDQSRNLGDPAGRSRSFGGAGQRPRGMHNLGAASPGVGPAHSSGEAGNDRGAKGPERKHAESEGGNSAWTRVPLRRTSRKVGEQFSS